MKAKLLQRFHSCLLVLGSLMVIALPVTSFADDHGNSPTTATAVDLPSTINGNVEIAGDTDWFKFTLAAPSVVTVVSGGTTDVVGHLLLGGARNSFTEIYSDNDSAGAPNFRLTQLLPVGTHYVYVHGYSATALGAYTLDFQVTPPPATQPDISLQVGGTELAPGALVDFGSTATGTPVSKDITVANVGDDDLRIYSIRTSIVGTLPTGATFPWRLLASPGTTVQAGRQSNLRIAFQPTVAGIYNAKFTVVSNDGDEIFSDVNVRGVASGVMPSPEIVVRDGATDVANNGSISVGSTQTNTRLTKDLTIANTGTGELKITSYSLLQVSTTTSGSGTGGNTTAAGTTATSVPVAITLYNSTIPTAIPAGGQATFTVALFNLVAGSYAAKLTLYNNDADENPTNINFTGTVTPDPVQGEIGVSLAGADVPNNSSISYGNAFTGSPVSKDFVIANSGTGDLKITSWSLGIPAPATVLVATTSVIGSPTATVASSTNLTVGMAVSYPFPSGTSITAINGTSITLSAAATSAITNANIAYYIGGVASTVSAFRVDSAVPTVIAAGASATVKLTYMPLQTGNHAAYFKAYNNDLDENPFTINLTGHADVNPNPGDIAISVNSVDVPMNSDVDCGSVPVGNSALKTLTITNTGTGELRLTGYQMSLLQPTLTSGTPSYFYISGTPASVLAPGQSGSLVVTFKPAAVGVAYKASITVSSTDPDENPYRFNVVGTGGAITTPAPEIDINVNGSAVASNGTFAFGSVNAGTLSQKSLLINNTGSAPLTISGMIVSLPLSAPSGTPNPFGVYSIAPATIQANSAYSTWLNFAPTSAGNFSAILQIASNDADENPYIINVTGTGVGTVAAPEIDVSLAGADVPVNSVVPYGSTTSGTPVSKQFTVNNTGNAPLALSGWTFQYPTGAIFGVSTTTTVGSPTATIAATTAATPIVPGMTVYGPFPIGTAVVSVIGTTVTFSAPALTAVTNSYISYYSPGVPVVSPFRFEGTLPTSVAAGASATFTLTYAPMAAGNHTMIARFTTNDLSENPYMFTVTGSSTGVAPTPEIAVSLNGVDAPLASTVAYGSTATGTPVTKQFTISNTGTAALTLSGWSFINPAPYTVVTATLTTGSTTATLNTTAGVTAGMAVAGPFPAGTTIVSITGTTATFSSAAVSTVTTGLTLYPAGTNTLNPFVFSGTLPSTIAPGASAPLTVIFSPQLAGSYGMNLRFTNNDTDENPYQLTLTGTSVGAPPAPEIAIAQGGNDVPIFSSVSYGSIVSGTTASKTYVISNTGNATLNLSGWSILPSATSTSVSTTTTLGMNIATVASSAALTPGMVITGPFPPGTSITSVSGTLVTFSAPATSTVANVICGYYPSGTSTVNPFRFDGALPSSVAPGATASFTLTYAPTAVGNHSIWVRVTNNDSDENPFQITATGSATAAPVAPRLTVNVTGTMANNSTLAYGSVAGGSGAAKSIFLVNSGTAPLTILGISTSIASSVPAGLPNAFSCSATVPPITLAPSASYAFTLSFAPANAGDYNGLIQITSNDPTQGVFSMNLTGTGSSTIAAPRIGLSQGGVDVSQNSTVSYGSTTSGSLVSKQFTISNTGNAALSIYSFSFPQPFGAVIGINTSTTAGSSVGTLSATTTSIVPGMTVGLPFPIGTSVVSVAGTSVTFSAPALNTTTNATLSYFQPGVPILNPFRLEGTYPTSVAAGATATFTITYAPLSAGNHTMSIALNNNDGGHGVYQFTVTGSATGVAPAPEIGVSVGGVDAPEGSTVALPATTTGVSATKQLVVSNTGSANLTLTGWSFSNPAPSIGTFVNTTAGSTSATLTSANTSLTAGMVVSGSNLPVNTTIVSISGTAVTFSAAASSTATSSFVQFYPSGTNMINPFAFSGTLPSSVAPGTTATVNVVFNATLPGTYSQNLRVTTNDPDENPFQLTLTGTASGTPLIPDIAVFSGTTSTTELAQNAAIDFGPISRGNIVYKDLVIKNLGTATLTYGYGYTTVLPTPVPTTSAFYTYMAPVTSIAPNGTTTLRVAFKPLALSTSYSTKLTFNSNDPDENPFTLTLTGTSLATDSEIGITADGANVPNNGSISYGSGVELDSTVAKTLVISNTGDGPLAMTGWMLAPAVSTNTSTTSPTPPPPFIIGGIPGSIAPGASVNVTVTYRPLSITTDNYILTLFNSDADEGTYKIYLSGTSVASSSPSEINFAVDGADVASGGTVALSTAVNVALNKDVVITNTGTGTLLIGGWSLQTVSPSGVVAITTVQGPPTSIPPGGTALLKIKFLPTAAGTNYAAKLTLFSTDADEGTYVVNVTGATTP